MDARWAHTHMLPYNIRIAFMHIQLDFKWELSNRRMVSRGDLSLLVSTTPRAYPRAYRIMHSHQYAHYMTNCVRSPAGSRCRFEYALVVQQKHIFLATLDICASASSHIHISVRQSTIYKVKLRFTGFSFQVAVRLYYAKGKIVA